VAINDRFYAFDNVILAVRVVTKSKCPGTTSDDVTRAFSVFGACQATLTLTDEQRDRYDHEHTCEDRQFRTVHPGYSRERGATAHHPRKENGAWVPGWNPIYATSMPTETPGTVFTTSSAEVDFCLSPRQVMTPVRHMTGYRRNSPNGESVRMTFPN
jgi:hypothetical protein